MTTLEGSIEGWWFLPSPKLDLSDEIEEYCELAATKYGASLRAIIILNGLNGEFYIALFGTSDLPHVMLSVMRENMNSLDFDKPLEKELLSYFMKADPNFTVLGVRGDEWELPDEITVFYYYPKDLVFPKGWNEIPQKILQSSKRK